MQKACTHCTDKAEDESLAMYLVKGYGKQAKNWFIAFIIVVCLWFATIGLFVWYLQLYDFSSETYTVEQDSTDGGNANYIGGNGDITNGETEGN